MWDVTSYELESNQFCYSSSKILCLQKSEILWQKLDVVWNVSWLECKGLRFLHIISKCFHPLPVINNDSSLSDQFAHKLHWVCQSKIAWHYGTKASTKHSLSSRNIRQGGKQVMLVTNLKLERWVCIKFSILYSYNRFTTEA